ncbi:MAG TPA: alkaline phosphatase PhoX [Jiangellales bacterium]|nr:alkaline phosphatase PhoX [Jiangellales bacterium]
MLWCKSDVQTGKRQPQWTRPGARGAGQRRRGECVRLAGLPGLRRSSSGRNLLGGFPKEDVSPISCPDNVAFDADGNLWISTDGNALGSNDGLFSLPVEGPDRGRVKQFMTVPVGAETCGPTLLEDGTSVFVAVQHPGEVSGASVENPASTWPDGRFPQPSVVAAWKRDR